MGSGLRPSHVIPHDTIDEIRNRMDIVDVVGDFVTLKRSGQNYRALSPFTNEKTPSFFVVPAKGIFKDFSSGKGGDAITFVMEHEGMSYVEALRYLAKKYGVEIREDPAKRDEALASQSQRDSLYIIMNFAKDRYCELLTKNEEGINIGLSYFRERGFNDRTLQKFELGYSLNTWDHLLKEAAAKGHGEELLEKAGLIIRREDGKKYDRFRGRVIFPVHNLSGKVIAFGARILTKEKDQPKYINSPETEIYHKSHVLYGMFQARNAIRKEEFCYLVEGYTDVISMHQADIENVVASSGTALTEDQIKIMRRFTENVTVLYDGDPAGIKAALRGIDLVLKGGLNVRIVLLPDGEDPDSYARKHGSTELQAFLREHAQDFISFKISLYAKDAAQDPIRKAEAIREIVTSIGVIPDPIKRAVYIQETSHLLNISEAVLLTELNKILIRERDKAKQERLRDEPKAPAETVQDIAAPSKTDVASMVQLQERETIRLLLNYADSQYEDQRLMDFVITELEDVEFSNTVYKDIYALFRQAADARQLPDTYYFMEHGSPEVKNIVAELTTHRYEASKLWSDRYHIYFPHEKEIIQDVAYSNILRLKFRVIQKLMEENLAKMKTAVHEHDLEQYFTIHEQLKGAEREIADLLGIVIPK